ncbi:MAG: PrsW family glutamic-type intramembrane protease [Eubacteriales bacterium]
MIYAENILIFLGAPLLIGLIMLKGETRRFIGFFLLGTVVCLLCSYINAFVTAVTNTDVTQSVIKLTPIVEEVMKALPLLFYIAVFLPKNDEILSSSLALGIGFATFENCCLVTISGADSLSYALVRGFAAGTMHILCAAILGHALTLSNARRYLLPMGTFASVAIAITFHAIYNLLVSAEGTWKILGYFMPLVTATLFLFIPRLMKKCCT